VKSIWALRMGEAIGWVISRTSRIRTVIHLSLGTRRQFARPHRHL
jgi:hypothetical protein